ncbi:MAG TPA: DUF5522 domain-containing protein [Cyclobacteriaceae bacterium]|nr:DUF5522 domain-containing protein [Cyclobacteriaceae bacterium]HRF35486.1 DUF5522 domain-containing protein [Cyclobacteriaceae bacterium]
MAEEKDRIELKEGIDYYLESGLLVFTSAYHLKRGFCCANQCRHCPYQSKTPKKKPSETLQ